MASTIVTKNSSTASAVPVAGDLTKGELAVNVTDKRLFTKDNSGSVVELGINPSSLTLSGGTANGVGYLNGSKVLTTGSAFSFDGTTQTLANASNTANTYNGINFTTAYTPTGTTNTNTDALVSFYGLDQNGVSGTYAGIKASHLTNSAVKSSSVGYLRLDTNQLSSGAVSANTNSYLQLVGGGASTLSSVGNLTLNAGVATGTGARIVFNADDGTEKMRLNGTGLGIGTTTPGYLLDVNGTANFASTVTFTGGTANGVGYLNGSKQFTTGSALTFDGTNLTVSNAGAQGFEVRPNSGDYSGGINLLSYNRSTSAWAPMGQFASYFAWLVNASEQMRLTSTGLGIGTSSPSARFHSLGTSTTAYDGSGAGSDLGAQLTPGTAIVGNTDTTVGSFAQLVFQPSKDSGPAYARIAAIKTAAASSALAFSTRDGSTVVERARIDSSGNLLVGKTSSGASTAGCEFGTYGAILTRSSGDALLVNRETDDGAAVTLRRSNVTVGTISVTTSATAYNTSSDYRLKDNQQPLTGSGAFIDALQPKTWEWKADGSKGVGFIAHEVQAVSPGSVVGEKDAVDEDGKPKYQAMEYGSAEFIANIVAELQSLRQRVAQLEGK